VWGFREGGGLTILAMVEMKKKEVSTSNWMQYFFFRVLFGSSAMIKQVLQTDLGHWS
jgi:hypothetical protein